MRFVWLLVLFPCALSARPLAVPALPPSAFADTESVTNIVFDAGGEHLGKFDIRLAADVTPSNNVQIAVGVDANGNGTLEPMETEVVLGWDCGAWFVRDERADWLRRWPAEPGARELAYTLRIFRQQARALMVTDGDDALLTAARPVIPASLFNPCWNLLRVTSRGAALRNELVTIGLSNRGLVLEVR